MENSPPPPNDAAKEESPSPPSKKPKLDDGIMEVDSDVDPDSWEPHVDVDVYGHDSEEESDEEKWKQYNEKLKGGGYDLDCYGPRSLMAVYSPYWSKYDEVDPDDPYDEVNDMAEFVIRDLNADESNDKTYKLVEVERVVWTSSLLYLLTFTAKELPPGVDADAADAAVITFQASVHGFPVKPHRLVSRRVKPVSNA